MQKVRWQRSERGGGLRQRQGGGTGADTLLGPEMRSTGEVMGIDTDFGRAYAKAAIAAGQKLPTSGNVFITMIDKYKEAIVPVAKQLQVEPQLPTHHLLPSVLHAKPLDCCVALNRTESHTFARQK